MPDLFIVLVMAILVVAFLYSSVGHAGASGYIAVMSLLSLAPEQIKPTALSLNILVATITFLQFWRAGHFSWKLFWPFAILAIPMAFLGGFLDLPIRIFKVLVGTVLVFSAWRLVVRPSDNFELRECSQTLAIFAGGVLGLLAGLTGTGGGIFLTPFLLFMRWAHAKQAAAVSALFILVNSTAGLLGNFSSTRNLPSEIPWLLLAAVIGGSAGSYFGSRRFNGSAIKRLLAIVLLIAGIKLIFT
jgi:uncharacterized protein